MNAEDRIALHELVALYGNLIDERRWDEYDQVFTPDAIYESDRGGWRTTSLEELVEFWKADMSRHPLAHHTTNVVVTEQPDGTATIVSKGIGVGRKGRVGSVTYRDVAVRTDQGWRLAKRVVSLRRSEDW
jgi:3-phenylpropionate/cinnamic acid dioxygenase small subunit